MHNVQSQILRSKKEDLKGLSGRPKVVNLGFCRPRNEDSPGDLVKIDSYLVRFFDQSWSMHHSLRDYRILLRCLKCKSNLWSMCRPSKSCRIDEVGIFFGGTYTPTSSSCPSERSSLVIAINLCAPT